MCEFKQEFSIRRSRGNWDGKYLYQIIGADLEDKTPYYNKVEAGRCMFCSKPLSEHDMFPPGRMSRSLCEKCYQKFVVKKINKKCIISGQKLPQYKIDEQRRQPRELEYNIADGAAFDKWCILHEKVTLGDMSWLADEGAEYRLPEPEYHLPEPEIIDAEFYEEDGYPKALPPRQTPALPPARFRTFLDFSSIDRPEKVTIDEYRNVIPKRR